MTSRSMLAILLLCATPLLARAQTVPCGGPFEAWLSGVRREALSRGITSETLAEAAPLLKTDASVLAKDRGQKVFAQNFVEFAGRMADGYRVPQGRERIRRNGALFERIEREFGVPAPVIVAFWALETDFGANTGDIPTIRSLTTLAHDCRRPELFREQLFAALRLLQGNDLPLEQMKGPFAGELGQLQFLPTHYVDYAVDFDGDGRRNLVRSAPDALASAANYAAKLGWRRGEPWLEEVRLPSQLPWEQAGTDIAHPRSQWSRWGVTRVDGARLPTDALEASLLLPAGRHGPAFLAYPNFLRVHLEWNKSLVYATTAAYLATRLDGRPKMTVHGKVPTLGIDEMKSLQRELAERGHDVGKIDGVLGNKTRIAVRDEQRRLGLPADSYPTAELLQALRSARRS